MPKLTIDGKEVEVAQGHTILDAAHKLGIDIPTLCHWPGRKPQTSCLVCVVKLKGAHRLFPACAMKAVDGMHVESETPDVHLARRTALELILGDHLGDCIAPCNGVCPARMNIPLMIRQIAAGQLREALITVKRRIALPAVLGRICPELCEHGCRRGAHDAPVSICLLKRHVADVDLASGNPYLPPCQPPTGKKVAIVGAGPAGLSAAYYLAQFGHACTVFDEHELPGGALRYAIGEDILPRNVLDAEIDVIRRLGVRFEMNRKLGEGLALDDLRRDYDAALLAIGEVKTQTASELGLAMAGKSVKAHRHTWMTDLPGVFVAGSTFAPAKHAVRAVGSGRCCAEAIHQFLGGHPIHVDENPYSVHIGRVAKPDMPAFLPGHSPDGRVTPAGGKTTGLAKGEAVCEAVRCVRCDCDKTDNCRLRVWAMRYGANPTRFRREKMAFLRDESHPEVIFEPGKCIKCGLCVQIASDEKETLGLTFVGRGFDVKIGVPFHRKLLEGLRKAARLCAEACPTGAISLKEETPHAEEAHAPPGAHAPGDAHTSGRKSPSHESARRR